MKVTTTKSSKRQVEASSPEEETALRKREALDAIPEPWSYNPSGWDQRIPICILAMVACVIASYMGFYQWRLIGSVWDPVYGKQTQNVLNSNVSDWMRYWILLPDAVLGAFGYLGDAIFGLAGSTRRWQYRPWLVVIFGIDVIPLGIVSVILVVLQGTVVGYWCFPCLITAAISLVLVYMAADEVWSCLLFLHRVWRETGSRSILWKTFCGRWTPEAEKIAADFVRLPEEASA